jgi:predicted ATPase
MQVIGRLLGFEVEGYRSLRSLRVDTGPLTVLVGDNGVGKSNLFRALDLIAAAGEGSLCRRLASEGGLKSVVWAGSEQSPATSMNIRLSARFENLAYRIEIAPPESGDTALEHEPVVRDEHLYRIGQRGTTQVLRREGSSIWLRDANGQRHDFRRELLPSETAISSFRDSGLYPELAYLRHLFMEWRFYPGFRMGESAPARLPSLAVSAPALSADGGDLAAMLATHARFGSRPNPIDAAMSDAFPGSSLDVTTQDGRASFTLKLADLDRPLSPHEISEGTLQYLCLAAALTGYRPPRLIALNEPESGLHPRLLGPLARLITRAAAQSQIMVVTHSVQLAEEVSRAAGVQATLVVKEHGATILAHQASAMSAPTPVIPIPDPPAPEPSPAMKEQMRIEALREALNEIAQLLEGHRAVPANRHLLLPELRLRMARIKALGAEVPVELTVLAGELDREYGSVTHG